MKSISSCCQSNDLKLHLDGARLFNALSAADYSSDDISGLFDSISICLSKGLGAPVGSVLLGSKELIRQSRRIRKVLGGGMRQTGYLAAAGLYAIENNVIKLKEDHARAKSIGNAFFGVSYVDEVLPIETNIVLIKTNIAAEKVINAFADRNILVVGMGENLVRFVTHLDFKDEELEVVLEEIKKLNP
jgi:threonine aldolase